MTRKTIPCSVENLIFSRGEVNAKVLETRSRPYETHFTCREWDQSQWQDALNILTSEAYYFATLMNGELPVELQAKMTSHQLKLHPEQQEWSFSCTCSDPQPCKHTDAVYSAFTDRLDQDPLLLFVIRGLDKDQLMSQLRTLRSVKLRGRVKNEDHPLNGPESKAFSSSPDEGKQLKPGQPSANLLSDVTDPEFWTKEKTLSQTLQPAYRKVGRKAKELLKAQPNKSLERGDH